MLLKKDGRILTWSSLSQNPLTENQTWAPLALPFSIHRIGSGCVCVCVCVCVWMRLFLPGSFFYSTVIQFDVSLSHHAFHLNQRHNALPLVPIIMHAFMYCYVSCLIFIFLSSYCSLLCWAGICVLLRPLTLPNPPLSFPSRSLSVFLPFVLTRLYGSSERL